MNFESAEILRASIKDSLENRELKSDLSESINSQFQSKLVKALSNAEHSGNLGVGIGLKGQKTPGFRLEFRAFNGQAEKLAQSLVDALVKNGDGSVGKSDFRVRRILPGRFTSSHQKPESELLELLRDSTRPFAIGSAIGNYDHESLGFGSMGPIIVLDDSTTGFLTCNHVLLGFGVGDIGNKVTQPPGCLIETPNEEDVIGKIRSAVRVTNLLESPRWNKTDVSCVEFLPSINHDELANSFPEAGSKEAQLLTDDGFPEELLGEEFFLPPSDLFTSEEKLKALQFFKVGAGSGYTEGQITGYKVPGLLTRKEKKGRVLKYYFSEIIEVEAVKGGGFSCGGDSGATVYCRDTVTDEVYVVGLILGETKAVPPGLKSSDREKASKAVSFVTPIDVAMDSLRVRVDLKVG